MKHLTVSCLALCAINLSGCAQIANFGDMIWSETKSLTLTSKNKLMAALRPRSERADPVFVNDSAIAEYETVHTPLAEINPAQPYAEAISQYTPQPESVETTNSSNRPYDSYHAHADIQPIKNTQYSYTDVAQPPFMGSQTASDLYEELPDLSYVKLTGSPTAIDWKDCQAQAGGYIIADHTGFRVRPDFDYCMRVKGYVPEREAARFLEIQALP